MNYKKILLIAIIFIIFTLLISCNMGQRNKNNIGGVYSSVFNKENFSEEITSSSSIEESIESSNNEFEKNVSNTAEYSNKLLRWGISRKKDNTTPDADPGAPELLNKYNSIYIGNKEEKKIYLTFDEGYENGYTSKILDVLRDNNVKGVFFITGPYLKEHQDLVRRMVEEGHIVGNHTIHHPSLPSLSDEELEEEILGLNRAFYEKFGENMKFLRPPKGEYSERTLAITSKIGYINMFWSFAYDDWYRDKIRGPQYAVDKVISNLHNGAIILLHAVSKDNADALDTIIKTAIEKGYEIGDPSTLISK